MRERRGWVVASVLTVLGALAAGGAVREHWLACRGSMLSGSVLHGYAYGADFNDACLRAMDDGFAILWPDGEDPLRTEAALGLLAALAFAAAWLAVVTTSAWSSRTRLVAVVPSVLVLAACLLNLAPASQALDTAYTWVLLAVSTSVLLAFVAIGVRESPGALTMAKTALALAGPGAIGFVPFMADYIFMSSVSDANWDTPPGTGYPTVALTAVAGLAVLVLSVRPRRKPAPAVAAEHARA